MVFRFRRSAGDEVRRVEGGVFLSLGSNEGDRAAFLAFGVDSLDARERSSVIRRSWVYETDPVGLEGASVFLNMAVEIETDLRPHDLLLLCFGAERRAGRVRVAGRPARPLDIDIALFRNEIVRAHDLIVPHPRMHERRFVLEPLFEIGPEARHPALGLTVRELRSGCPDRHRVVRAGPLASFFVSP